MSDATRRPCQNEWFANEPPRWVTIPLALIAGFIDAWTFLGLCIDCSSPNRISKQATAKGTLVAIRTWVGMTNDKNHDEKQPGEHPDGTFHYNPGNMAGKKPQDEEQTAENRGETQPEEKPAG
jgi:secreted protein with Ig-like and vWFA domain